MEPKGLTEADVRRIVADEMTVGIRMAVQAAMQATMGELATAMAGMVKEAVAESTRDLQRGLVQLARSGRLRTVLPLGALVLSLLALAYLGSLLPVTRGWQPLRMKVPLDLTL